MFRCRRSITKYCAVIFTRSMCLVSGEGAQFRWSLRQRGRMRDSENPHDSLVHGIRSANVEMNTQWKDLPIKGCNGVRRNRRQ